MASRNLPPSFFNAHYHAQVKAAGHYSGPASDLYSSEAAYSGLHHLAAHHHAASGSAADPWQYAAQVTPTYKLASWLISPGVVIMRCHMSAPWVAPHLLKLPAPSGRLR